jgi:hypothetical protein
MSLMTTAPAYTEWLVRTLSEAVDQENTALYQKRVVHAQPIPVTVTRHQCPHCRRTWAKQPAATAHIARCWKNPDVRSCKTCTHFDEGGDACGCEPGCNWGGSPIPPSCDAGMKLPDDYQPVINCPLWNLTD